MHLTDLQDRPSVATPEFLDAHAREVLSFYHPACIDPRGGFHQYFLPDGQPDRANRQRHLVSSARLTLNFAVAARHFGDATLLDAARHGVAFLRSDHHNARTGGYAWIIDDGRVVDGDNQAYGIAFVLMAYARAFQAGVAEAGPLVAETFHFMEQCFWQERHALYADTRSADLMHLDGYRGQNANMHACEALIAAFEATGERRYLDRAHRIAHQLTVTLAWRTGGRIWEHYDADWHQDFSYNQHDPDNKLRPWGYQPGHFAEWAKLLLFVHQHDPQPWLLDRARSLFDEAMATGFDELHGGLYYSVAPDGTPCSTGKYSWVQAETIAAAAFLASALGNGHYWCVYHQLWAYVQDHMVHGQLKYWHRNLTRDNQPSVDVVALGRTDYHAIGACIDVSALLRRRRAAAQ
jgi:mannose/cellobiose epimerase-like protein (N-acyl-D-glucosamine 2-epimerase family)